MLEKLLARLKELAIQSVEPQQWKPPYQGESYYCKDCPLHAKGRGPGVAWSPWCEDNGENAAHPCIPVDPEQKRLAAPFADQQDAHLTHDARVQ